MALLLSPPCLFLPHLLRLRRDFAELSTKLGYEDKGSGAAKRVADGHRGGGGAAAGPSDRRWRPGQDRGASERRRAVPGDSGRRRWGRGAHVAANTSELGPRRRGGGGVMAGEGRVREDREEVEKEI